MNEVTFSWKESLRLANQDEELANDLLDMFEKELPHFLRHIQQARESDDIHQLQQQIHKLHGACCYCGVPRLKQLTAHLEDQLTIAPTATPCQFDDLVQQVEQEMIRALDAIPQRHEC